MSILSFQTSGSNVRANVILISQGQIGSLSNEDALKVQEMSKKHQFRLYNMPLVHKMNNMSLHFETLSHSSGGNTFIIQPNKPNRLDVYMDILDALREIRRRSESNGPSLVRYYSQCIYPLEIYKFLTVAENHQNRLKNCRDFYHVFFKPVRHKG